MTGAYDVPPVPWGYLGNYCADVRSRRPIMHPARVRGDLLLGWHMDCAMQTEFDSHRSESKRARLSSKCYQFRFWALLAWIVGFTAAPSQVVGQLIVSDSNVGYIDSAVLGSQVRLRFDAAYKSRSADRVEFVYAKYGQPGAPLVERGIDGHQELAAYLEHQTCDWLSFFAEVPFRWIDPVVNDNTGSLYDMTAGAKLSLWEMDDAQVTAQFRTYLPTGDANSGLGTDHVSLEPSLLYLEKLSDRITFEAELRDWIPINASTTGPGGGQGGGGGGGSGGGQGGQREFSGNVLRYGFGFGYRAYQDNSVRITPVTEVVGWHVFSGLKSTNTGDRISAAGDHITNLKVGLRLATLSGGTTAGSNVFVGYGTVLTDDIWYSDILRLEYRKSF